MKSHDLHRHFIFRGENREMNMIAKQQTNEIKYAQKGHIVKNVMVDTDRNYLTHRILLDSEGSLRPIDWVDPARIRSSTQKARRGDLVLTQIMNLATGQGYQFYIERYIAGDRWAAVKDPNEMKELMRTLAPNMKEYWLTWLKSVDKNDMCLPFGQLGNFPNPGEYRRFRILKQFADAPQAWLDQVSTDAGHWSDIHQKVPEPLPRSLKLVAGQSALIRYRSKQPDLIQSTNSIQLHNSDIMGVAVVSSNYANPTEGFPMIGNRWTIYGSMNGLLSEE